MATRSPLRTERIVVACHLKVHTPSSQERATLEQHSLKPDISNACDRHILSHRLRNARIIAREGGFARRTLFQHFRRTFNASQRNARRARPKRAAMVRTSQASRRNLPPGSTAERSVFRSARSAEHIRLTLSDNSCPAPLARWRTPSPPAGTTRPLCVDQPALPSFLKAPTGTHSVDFTPELGRPL